MLTTSQARLRIAALVNSDQQTNGQTDSYYDQAMAEISHHLHNFYVQYARANNLSLNETKVNVNSWDLSQWKQAINQMDSSSQKNSPAWLRIKGLGATAGIDKAHMLSSLAKLSLVGMSIKVLKQVKQTVAKDGNDEALFLKQNMGLNKKTVAKLVQAVKNRPDNYSAGFWADTDKLCNQVENIITTGLRKGMDLGDIRTMLSNDIKDMHRTTSIAGRVHVMDTNAQRLIRTESAKVVNETNLAAYREVNVTTVTWVNEDNPCDLCISIEDAGPYPIDTAPVPPAHPNCRDFLYPIQQTFMQRISNIFSS